MDIIALDKIKRKRPAPRGARRAPDFFSADVARERRFFLDLRPGRNRRLTVACGGLEHCTPGYAIHRETFPFHSIEYVVRGRGEVKLKGRTHPLCPGRVFSYGPGVPHHITGDPADPLVKYFVDFSGKNAASLLAACGLAAGRVSRVYPPNALQAIFDELIESGRRARRRRPELCGKLLESLTLKITASNMPAGGSEALAFATYQRCRQHLDRHFLRLRTLGEIANECHLTQGYLCRLFRRFDRQSPYQYLTHLKISLAAERLQQPGSLIKQVAREAGFADPFHFSRVFKNAFGVSPQVFRRMR